MIAKEEGADAENEEPKRGHGGCGHIQPQIRKEGLKLFLQYKKTKDDDDVCPKFYRLSDADVVTGNQVIPA
jgi:hypothetical protein